MTLSFEIKDHRQFLQAFMDKRNMYTIPSGMVDLLKRSEDPYKRYGYGCWLIATRPDGDESLREAEECFIYASKYGIADAKEKLSRMHYFGEVYNRSKGIFEKNNVMALILNAQAQEEESEDAKLQNCYDLYLGNLIPANRELALKRCMEGESMPGASILWTEQLGWMYELEGRQEEAEKKYAQCIENGLYTVYFDLAFMYREKGDMENYRLMMEKGIEKDVPACMIYGFEHEEDWDELSPEQQEEIHQRLKKNLYRGVELGNGQCAYVLAFYLIHGKMGFKQDITEGLRIADQGIKYRNMYCCELVMDYLDQLQDSEGFLTLQLKALRYGYIEKLEDVMNDADAYEEMGYGDEIRKVWKPKWDQILKERETAEEEQENEPLEPLPVLTRTEINPTVLVIHPSGYVDFVEADVYPMSFSQMGELIGAESLDAVHFSDALTKITRSCRLTKNVAMYVDRNGIAKDLPDNAVGTMLYGRGYEIRGAVIIALEDNRYDTHSFEFEEDIESVYDAIDDLTGLLRRDLGQEDGKFDAWA